MIVFLATSGHRFTMRMFLASWGRPLAHRIVPVTYDDVLCRRSLRAATYVFADLERLDPVSARAAAWLRDALAAHGLRVLNHPGRSLRRHDLLRALHQRGSNRFAAYRLGEAGCVRFPVFVRRENDHAGSRTGLLHDAGALAAAIAGLEAAGVRRDELLVTEFCDTADAGGVYRKYSAFVIGDRVVPRHVFFSRHWMVKMADLVEPDLVHEERGYVESNPHESELRAIFHLAGVEWGRIDYALLDGAPQVWEINTNPQLMSFEDGGGPTRLPAHACAAIALRAAIERIDHAGAPRRLRLPRGPYDAKLATGKCDDAGRKPSSFIRAMLRRTPLLWYEERLRRWARPFGISARRGLRRDVSG